METQSAKDVETEEDALRKELAARKIQNFLRNRLVKSIEVNILSFTIQVKGMKYLDRCYIFEVHSRMINEGFVRQNHS